MLDRTVIRCALLALLCAGLAVRGHAQDASRAKPSASATAGYRLQPSDKFLFRIEQDPVRATEPETLAVNALGEIHFPISRGSSTLVTIEVRGKTLEDVKAELKSRLDADFYFDAKVEIRLLERTQRMGQVLLYGRGVRGGAISLAPGERKTILEAVIQAGATEFANLRKVRLHRVDPATQKTKTEVVDVEDIKKTGDRSKDIILQDGDRIEVPERGAVFN